MKTSRFPLTQNLLDSKSGDVVTATEKPLRESTLASVSHDRGSRKEKILSEGFLL